MTLNVVRQKERGAAKGHVLLKRKSDALTARFRAILGKIHAAKVAMGEQLRAAAFAVTEVHFAAGAAGGGSDDLGYAIREAVQGPAAFQVGTRLDNVSGTALPVFEAEFDAERARAAFELTALSRGGQAVARARDAHVRALKALLDLASWQIAFLLLDDVIRATNRRVNALEYIVIPRLEATLSYISGELDEQDREEFFRLKKVQAKKKLAAELKSGYEEGVEASDAMEMLNVDPDPTVRSLF